MSDQNNGNAESGTEAGKPSKLKLRDVQKAFNGNHVLRGVDLTLGEGKSLVIIGGSGSGKSVMLKAILGLITPDSGSILVDGKETMNMDNKGRDEVMRKFGMLFQGGALFDSLSIWENIGFGLMHNQKKSREEARAIAVEKLKQVGLSEKIAESFPAELSGGMQKRVSLARAIATNPEIIFFDEPTTGLDPIMADVINDLIVETVRDIGATALSITHDMASVRKIADEVGMIYKGRIIWQGDVDNLDDSGNDHVHQFINGNAEGPITDDMREEEMERMRA